MVKQEIHKKTPHTNIYKESTKNKTNYKYLISNTNRILCIECDIASRTNRIQSTVYAWFGLQVVIVIVNTSSIVNMTIQQTAKAQQR